MKGNMLGMGVSDNTLSVIKDPFKKECVKAIWFWVRQELFTDKWEFTAKVEFVNGNTKGEQSFKAVDFPSLVKQVEQFLQTI